jgi:4-hydroxy-3-polyprenylbenzoate decarboxylase
MTQATEAGAIIMPPVPAFYTRPGSVSDIIDDTVRRSLDLLGLDLQGLDVPNERRWDGDRSR